MLYGLYLSAAGVITSSYRQDVIANNLANSETVGFKRDLATFAQRPTADQTHPLAAGFGNPMLDKIGGGTFASPNYVDTTQGTLDPTDNNMDAAILGNGFFTVAGKDGQPRLTRDGRFKVDLAGRLTLSNDQASPVLDNTGKPIRVDPALPIRFDLAGRVLQDEQPVAQLGLASVANPASLKKEGAGLFSDSDPSSESASTAQVRGGFLEHSNVDPASELTALMDTQRVLEANANMMHYQDQMLGDLVNTVGKIS
jgi:flagellar basal-body rod protein FlgF